MEPGRALDALIAEHVMGWERVASPSGAYDRWRTPDGTPAFTYGPIALGCFRPSQDMNAAWQVVEHMQANHHGCEIWCPNSGGMRPRVQFYSDAWGEHEVAAETVPLAICRAALATCQVEA